MFARVWGLGSHADDFSQNVLLAAITGRKATLKQLMVDYIRSEFGAQENHPKKASSKWQTPAGY